jgi:drug/metabolite transporter (DMT)-like permease
VRPLLALLAGLAVAGIAGAVLGEYDFDGWAAIGSGLLTGVFVGEAVVTVARKGSRALAAATALMAIGGMLWAGWTTTGHRLGTVGWKGWAAVALAGVAGGIRARPTAGARSSHSARAGTE